MKKGCLILLGIVAVLLLGLVIAGFVGFRIANQRFGVSLAPEISHETYADADTRIRLVVKPELVTPYIEAYLPDDVEINTAGFKLADVMNHVVPREMAFLARSDVIGKKVRLTLFANERRGGPLLEMVVRESNVFASMPQVSWTTEGLELRGRGALLAEGDIPIPEAAESEILSLWPTRAQAPPATVRGGHMAELVVDNRNGDILAFASAAVTASGDDWEKLRAEGMADMVVNIIESIYLCRLTADMQDMDTIAFSLRIDMHEDEGPGLHSLLSFMVMPWLRGTLRNEHNLVLEGEIHWDEAEKAILGDYTITGLEAFIRKTLEETS